MLMSPTMRIQNEWRDERDTALQKLRKVIKGRVEAMDATEQEFRSQLRESIEEMRKNLLESKNDYNVRTMVNENFISTSRATKDDLRRFREEQAQKIEQGGSR